MLIRDRLEKVVDPSKYSRTSFSSSENPPLSGGSDIQLHTYRASLHAQARLQYVRLDISSVNLSLYLERIVEERWLPTFTFFDAFVFCIS